MMLLRLAAVCGFILATLAIPGNAGPPSSATDAVLGGGPHEGEGQPRASSAAPPASLPVVVIDPGHPSETSEGRTPLHGTTELEVDWQIGQLLKHGLEASGTAKVVLTRTEKDRLSTNRERAECANLHGAALMIRLHCDVGNRTGYCLYFPDHQGTKDGVTGPSVEVQERSRAAASAIRQGLVDSLGQRLKDNGIKTDRQTFVGGKQGALTGSIFSQVPVVTIEMVYLDNASDAAFITSPEGSSAMAAALATGISRWLALLPDSAQNR